MQKLGILATVLLLTAAIIGPVGLSYAQTADTAAVAKTKAEKARDAFDQERAARLEAQKQKAADIKAQMQAKKMQAAKDIEATIAARAEAVKKQDLPTAADVLAQIREQAQAAIEARKAPGGPSKSQVDLEKQREEFAMKVKSQKEYIPVAPEKDLKVKVDTEHKVPKTQKELGALDQKAKEEAQKAQAEKAAEVKKSKYGSIHYNRK
ncbi:MAG: hypothetical protein QXN55_06900 [Candidatus Nitrosotenuis sp.]|jgi:colicin import membrane protein